MADPAKHVPVVHGGTLISDLKRLFSVLRARGTVTFCSGFTFAFVVFTVFFTFSPNASNIFRTIPTPTTGVGSSSASPRSQFSSVFSYFFPNNPPSVQIYSLSPPPLPPPLQPPPLQPNSSRSTGTTISTPTVSKEIPNSENQTRTAEKPENSIQNQTLVAPTNNASSPSGGKNQTQISEYSGGKKASQLNNQTAIAAPESPKPEPSSSANKTASVPKPEPASVPKPEPVSSEEKNTNEKSVSVVSNKTASLEKKQKQKQSNGSKPQGKVDSVESLRKCDLYDGSWVKDESYKPYYKPGSCSIIDEQFNCILNGRPDKDYQKFRWKPKGCDLPRLDGKRMLEMIRGKRLVFVGDSLNRNMWESLVCILRNSVKDPKKVFEAHGRHHFRGEAEYSFIFKDYDSSVEFFVSPFLVQEWETTDKNGTKKETLRLDLIGKTAQHYKTAEIIIFNTGHWWTHEKTSKGEDYYQEGSHVYKELNVLEAFDKALTTWARWVDGNVGSNSTVLYRGYSDSHFSGGQWNSGGACDSETVPINDEKYLRPYPPKMAILEKVLRGMKTPVTYLNVTRLTDFRKDGHPSIYRKQSLSEEERRSPLLYQDCSHWCLPGVPDAWNELLYAELLVKLGQKHQQQQQQQKKT